MVILNPDTLRPAAVRAALDFWPDEIYFPPVAAVKRARSGEIWLRREDRPGRDQLWTILNATGNPLARLRSPRTVVFHVLDRDHAWAVEADEFNVPRVVRYRIRRD